MGLDSFENIFVVREIETAFVLLRFVVGEADLAKVSALFRGRCGRINGEGVSLLIDKQIGKTIHINRERFRGLVDNVGFDLLERPGWRKGNVFRFRGRGHYSGSGKPSGCEDK